MQLRWVDGAPMAHQHVAEVGIEATIDWGSPKPTGEVHWQARGFQLRQSIEVGVMMVVLLARAEPPVIHVGAQ